MHNSMRKDLPQKPSKDKVALTLSGGGFRATLFHLGSLWRLNELAWLEKIDCITGVSGGSITAAILGLNWKKLDFKNGVAKNFKEIIAEPIIDYTNRRVDWLPVILTLLGGLFGGIRNKFMARSYAVRLFGKSTLQDFPAPGEGPLIIIFATSLQTGEAVCLSREQLYVPKIGWIGHPNTRLSYAVAGSSAFPPLLSPVSIKVNPSAWRPLSPLSDLFKFSSYKSKLVLTDGGVYDNLGLQEIWEDYSTLLVSDAGSPLDSQVRPSTFIYFLFRRAVDIMYGQAQNLRKQILNQKLSGSATNPRKQTGAYWCITDSIDSVGCASAIARDTEETQSLAQVRTRLNKFTDNEKGDLINWGYALTDANMRTKICPEAQTPNKWPIPKYAFKPIIDIKESKDKMTKFSNFALAISGHSLRGVFFHLGSLLRLNEVGLLKKIDCISSVSFSSILACVVALNWTKFVWSNGVATNFKDLMFSHLANFSLPQPNASHIFLSFLGVQKPNLAKVFERDLFKGNPLMDDLPAAGNGPKVILNAASLQTGSRVEISRERIWDSRIGYLKPKGLTVANILSAVCSEQFFRPFKIACDPRAWHDNENSSDLYTQEEYRSKLCLVDAIFIGESGFEAIRNDYDCILVSDATNVYQTNSNPKTDFISLIGQFIGIALMDSKLREREKISNSRGSVYWSIGSKISDYQISNPLTLDTQETQNIINLGSGYLLSEKERGMLINWGYAIADAAFQQTGLDKGQKATEWPSPEYAPHPFGLYPDITCD